LSQGTAHNSVPTAPLVQRTPLELRTVQPAEASQPLKLVTPAVTPLAVDVREAAAMMRVSVKTVRRMVHSGDLPALQLGRYVRIRVAAIENFLRGLELRGRVKAGAKSA